MQGIGGGNSGGSAGGSSGGGASKYLPYIMAAGQALSDLGSTLDGSKKRQLELQKQQQNQQGYLGFAGAINDQRQQVGRTPGMEYILRQMAGRLGMSDMPINRTKLLEIKPVSGNYTADRTFADQYGGQYAQDYYNQNKADQIRKAMKKQGNDPMEYYNIKGNLEKLGAPNAVTSLMRNQMGAGRSYG